MANDTKVTIVIGSDIDQKAQKSFVTDTRDSLLGSLEKNGVLKTVCFDGKHIVTRLRFPKCGKLLTAIAVIGSKIKVTTDIVRIATLSSLTASLYAWRDVPTVRYNCKRAENINLRILPVVFGSKVVFPRSGYYG